MACVVLSHEGILKLHRKYHCTITVARGGGGGGGGGGTHASK